MPNLLQTLDGLLSRHYNARTPGAALMFYRKGHILYQGCAGTADLNTGEAITPATTFRLASVSKQFTAMCLHLLAHKTQLNLEDELALYFPELSHFKGVRLQHLLTHTSGLPDFEEHIPAQQTSQLTDLDVLDITAAQEKLLFPPGTRYRYSNTAFVLLGLQVERVASMNLGDFLQENVFQPLQMQHTRLYTSRAAIPDRAMGYALHANGHFILSDQSIGSATRGDGCIYTSAEDYLKWHQALQTNPLFNITYQPSPTSNIPGIPENAKYGMGWFYEKLHDGQRLLLHSGDTCGFTNLVIRQPEEDVLLACFSNIANNQPFLHELLRELKGFPEVLPPSKLVWQLPHLTR